MGGPGEAVRSGRPRGGEAVDRRDHVNRATPAHPVRPEPGMQRNGRSTAPAPSTTTRPLKGRQMEPFTGHDAIDHDEPPVHNGRVSQLKRLGIPGLLAEMYADRIDWHQIARLVQRGCPPRLALHIVRRPMPGVGASSPSHLWRGKRRPEDMRHAMRRPPEKNSRCVRKITMEIVMAGQSTENMEYVRRLLKQKQPGFAAALELAVDLVERELSSPEMPRDISVLLRAHHPGHGGSAHPLAVRRSRKDNQARRHRRGDSGNVGAA